MATVMLTEDQGRHIAASIHLLLADLAALAERSELDSAADAVRGVRADIGHVQRAAGRVLHVLGLERPRSRSVRQRLLSVAGVWSARVDELRARALRGYGPVHPDLAETLDPLIADVQRCLRRLGDSAQRLPEG